MTNGTDPVTIIPFEDFAKIDLRVATITKAEFHPNADKLLKLRLDDGTPEGRQVCAGIRQWYDPATLVGKQVVIVANLAPRTIRGEISQGMVLAASDLRIEALAASSTAMDPMAATAATAATATSAPTAPPSAARAAIERDVVILAVERPVKPGSKVS